MRFLTYDLIKLSDELDLAGLEKFSNFVDKIIKKMAEEYNKIDAFKKILRKQFHQYDEKHLNFKEIIYFAERIINELINPYKYNLEDPKNPGKTKPAFWFNDEEHEKSIDYLSAIKDVVIEEASEDQIKLFMPTLKKIDIILSDYDLI
jgi:hypothetical protein